jgi:hypothetical protein
LFLSRVINPYLELSAQAGLIDRGIQFSISNSLPVSFMGEINIENNLTTDEKREVLGYGPMQESTEQGGAATNLDIQGLISAYGVGVRAGSITAQRADEDYFREICGFPPASPEVDQVWESEGVRRPITLKSTEEREAELQSTIQNKKKR